MNLRLLPQAVLLTILAVCTQAVSQSQNSSQPIAFVHVHVIPMDRERVLDDQTVVVEDGRINAMESSKTLKPPTGARLIDATGKFLIPGLTDAHVHLYSTIEFPLYLASGVTTVFNLDGRPAHLLWRKQIADGTLLGPRIFTAGPLFGRAHTGDQDVRLVDEQADAGYDAVKIYNPVSREEFPALIAEAKRRHLLLMGHIARAPGFQLTIQSGQSIAHLDEFLYTYFNPQHDGNDEHVVLDESKIPLVAGETAAAGVYVIPTLHTYATTVQQSTDLDTFLKHPALCYLPPWALEQFEPAANRFKKDAYPEQSARMQAALAFQRKLVKALFDTGVPLMAGTDAPDVGPMAGIGIHEELEELVGDGLTPFQVLQTATVNPARYFGKSDEFGTIERGKRADLVLLERNPLDNISNTRGIVGVMVRGKWLSKESLAQQIEAIPDEYKRELQQVESELARNPAQAEQYLADHDPLRALGTAAITNLFRSQGPEKFHQLVVKMRVQSPKSRIASEAGINAQGYNFLAQNKFQDAIALLRMNTEDFPKSANTYDSLAEALFKSGDVSEARASYTKALEIDPNYVNAEFARKFVAEHK
ncbi:MAG TPA: amidohydrolase family protein [Terriglobales bacterium]|nr:amidohydrolase family protein [Terriglobales bacterium]